MALPASGQISLNQVNVELGLSGTAQIDMNSSAVRGLFDIASGEIEMSDGYGKSNYATGYTNGSVYTSSLGLSSTLTNGKVIDTHGNGWQIGASFGDSVTRWGGTGAITTSSINLRSSGNQGTTVSNMPGSTPRGDIWRDAQSLTNGSGDGYGSWYNDNTGQRAYPNINQEIMYRINNADAYVLGANAGFGANNSGGTVCWKPPAGTGEVLVQFANYHSNNNCSICVWNNSTGAVEHIIFYGSTNTTANTQKIGSIVNPTNSGVLYYQHDDDFIYFNTDHAGTVAGAHYYLFR